MGGMHAQKHSPALVEQPEMTRIDQCNDSLDAKPILALGTENKLYKVITAELS